MFAKTDAEKAILDILASQAASKPDLLARLNLPAREVNDALTRLLASELIQCKGERYALHKSHKQMGLFPSLMGVLC